MKKRILTYDELNHVINLRQSHASWFKIEKETGVPRRSARRAYEDWERDQTPQELKAARTNVAATALQEHLEDLITLASSLVANLRVPKLPEVSDADKFFSDLWKQDLLHRGFFVHNENLETIRSPRASDIRDPQSLEREAKMLFQSLKSHTADRVRWDSLDDWRSARTGCAKDLARLRRETRVIVERFLKLEAASNLATRMKNASPSKADPLDYLPEGIVKVIWKSMSRDAPSSEAPSFETTLAGPDAIQQTLVRSEEQTLFTSDDRSLAEKVAKICERTVNNLYRGEGERLIKSLRDEIQGMKKAVDKLEAGLNALVLKPLVLRTRCDLCPA